jgi:hypothetical protein
MNDWQIWIIIVALMFGATILYRYWKKRKAEKIKKDYDDGIARINREIQEKLKQ